MSAGYVAQWLFAFVATQAIEVPIYARALVAPRRLAKAALPSAITHPVIWFAIAPRFPGSYAAMLVVAETFAVVVEAAVLRAFAVRRWFAWSLLANAASLGAGALAQSLGLWPW